MLNDQLIDKRTAERNIKKGRVDASEYGRTLAALPDLSSRVYRQEEHREPVIAASEPPRNGWSDDNAQPAPLG
jgi:2,4-dienoyl-CoA reductase-like NADH-dependent reductase (Old Yellow Enzyme family)